MNRPICDRCGNPALANQVYWFSVPNHKQDDERHVRKTTFRSKLNWQIASDDGSAGYKESHFCHACAAFAFAELLKAAVNQKRLEDSNINQTLESRGSRPVE